MAKSISAEELQLRKRARRRLIGAIAVVTIVAVFLPMVLDHEPKPVKQDISIQIPSPNSGAFTSKIVPVMPAAKPAPAKSETPAADEPPKVAAAAPVMPAPPAHDTEAAPPKKPAPAKPAPKPAARSAAVAQPAAQPAAGTNAAKGFVVQVAALNDADKARQMQEQIAAAGVKSYTEVVPTARGNVTRVRAGPFTSREEAEKMRDQLKGMGLNGNIVPK
jgi:DedD protein